MKKIFLIILFLMAFSGKSFGQGYLYGFSDLDQNIVAYDVTTGSLVNTITNQSGINVELVFGPDGYLYTSKGNQTIAYNVNTGAVAKTLDLHLYPDSFLFGPDNYLYGFSDVDQNIVVYDVATSSLVKSITNQSGVNVELVFGPEGYLYTSKGNQTVAYDVDTGTIAKTLDLNLYPDSFLFGPDNYLYGFSDIDQNIVAYDVTTNSLVNTITNQSGINVELVFGPDGYLYTSKGNQTVAYNINNGSIVKTLDLHLYPDSFEFSPNEPVVSEPSTMLLFGSGLIGAFARRRKRA